MNNYIEPGEVLALTVPNGGVVSGTPYKIGSLVVVATVTVTDAQHDADPTIQFSAMVCGTAQLAKVSAQAWTEGAKIYWDDTAKLMTTSSGGNTLVGVAAAAAANPSATGLVRLDGVAR